MRWPLAVVAITAVIAIACDDRPPIASCTDDLHGVYITPSGARWALLDHGKTLEAFALFDDAAADGAPRVVDLTREHARTGELAGEVKRRYSRGGEHCEARAPIRVTTCEANELQLVLADPQPPLAFAPCAWGAPADSRVERWRRE